VRATIVHTLSKVASAIPGWSFADEATGLWLTGAPEVAQPTLTQSAPAASHFAVTFKRVTGRIS